MSEAILERCSVLVPMPDGSDAWITRSQALALMQSIELQLGSGASEAIELIRSAGPGVRFVLPGAFKPWERARRGANGAHYTSSASAEAQNAVALWAVRAVQTVKSQGVPWSPAARFALWIRARWADARRRDLDNVAKQVAEGLMRTAGVVLEDDSQIDRLVVERAPVGEPQLEVMLRRREG